MVNRHRENWSNMGQRNGGYGKMTDKERLELIKSKEKDAMYLLRGTMIRSDWYWLIEQAERVEELEEENDELAERVEELEEENDELAERVHKLALDWSELVDERNRYKQALKFGVKYLQNSNIRQVQLVVSALKQALEGKE